MYVYVYNNYDPIIIRYQYLGLSDITTVIIPTLYRFSCIEKELDIYL